MRCCMRTLLAVVGMFGAMGTAWAQGAGQPPIGMNGGALPQIADEAGGCATHVKCRRNLTSEKVTDVISSSGPLWQQLLAGGKKVTLSEALSAGVVVEELVRTVEATWGPCWVPAPPQPSHPCVPTTHLVRAEWTMKYTKEQVEIIFKASDGKEYGVLESAVWANGTLVKYVPVRAACPCCGTLNPADGRPQPRGGGGGGPAVMVPGPKPGGKPQEEPGEKPGIDRTSLGGDLLIELTASVGVGAAGGSELDSTTGLAVSFGGKLHGLLPEGLYAFFQDKFVQADVETEFFTIDRFTLMPVLVEGEEDIDIHALTAGVGYDYDLSSQFSLFGKIGVGRYFISGADGVNGHIIGSVDFGAAWNFADRFSAFVETGATFGSAHVHVDEGEGDVRRTWTVLLGAAVRF